MSNTVSQLPDAERMAELSEAVRCFTYKSVATAPDSHILYRSAIGLAEDLGYDDSFMSGDFDGVTLASGPSRGQQYVPGTTNYSPEDHIRGITGTIIDSPLHPVAQSFLITRAIGATYATRRSRIDQLLDGERETPGKGITERAAKKAALGEINGILDRTGTVGVEAVARDLSVVSSILVSEWYPHRAKVALGILGISGAGLLAAIRLKRHQ